MSAQLQAFNKMADLYRTALGEDDENVKFIKQLLILSHQRMDQLMASAISAKNTESSNAKTQGGATHRSSGEDYTSRPNLPNISQYKPSGTSNIFSPVIDINTSSPRNNERYADAFRQGFNQAIEDKSTHAYDINTRTGDIISTGDVTETGDINTAVGVGVKSAQKMAETKSETAKRQGYVRNPPDKDKIGMPGYSYLDPKYWDVPQRRNQVCIPQKQLSRGHTALEPAGYLSGGPSNVMEFHSVGSILPDFKYEEKADYVEDENNRI